MEAPDKLAVRGPQGTHGPVPTTAQDQTREHRGRRIDARCEESVPKLAPALRVETMEDVPVGGGHVHPSPGNHGRGESSPQFGRPAEEQFISHRVGRTTGTRRVVPVGGPLVRPENAGLRPTVGRSPLEPFRRRQGCRSAEGTRAQRQKAREFGPNVAGAIMRRQNQQSVGGHHPVVAASSGPVSAAQKSGSGIEKFHSGPGGEHLAVHRFHLIATMMLKGISIVLIKAFDKLSRPWIEGVETHGVVRRPPLIHAHIGSPQTTVEAEKVHRDGIIRWRVVAPPQFPAVGGRIHRESTASRKGDDPIVQHQGGSELRRQNDGVFLGPGLIGIRLCPMDDSLSRGRRGPTRRAVPQGEAPNSDAVVKYDLFAIGRQGQGQHRRGMLLPPGGARFGIHGQKALRPAFSAAPDGLRGVGIEHGQNQAAGDHEFAGVRALFQGP